MTAAIARRITCVVLLGVLAPSGDVTGRAALQARVWPAVALAPATVRIEVLIEKHDDNRTLRIVADSGEYLRSSTILLEGSRAPRFHSVMYRSMPAGHYDIQVELFDQTNTVRAIERHWVNVVF
jgi:hypothetical protein